MNRSEVVGQLKGNVAPNTVDSFSLVFSTFAIPYGNPDYRGNHRADDDANDKLRPVYLFEPSPPQSPSSNGGRVA